jgi:hypothetical protein
MTEELKQCCQMQIPEGKTITFLGKIVAHVKGDLLGRVLTWPEYYYLMFGCETSDDINLIKSMTPEECRYFVTCCWYFGVEHTNRCQLGFLKVYRRYPSVLTSPILPDKPLEKCPFCNETDTCKKCYCFALNRIQKQCEKAALTGRLREVEELQREFIGRTDSEIKDIMFFRKLELEDLWSKL